MLRQICGGLIVWLMATVAVGQQMVPADNLPNAAIALEGQKIFFDRRMSQNGTIACVDCHLPERGYTDNRNISVGVFGRTGTRNAPTLINVGSKPLLFHDGKGILLEGQMWNPVTNPVEHGTQTISQVVNRLNQTGYRADFQQLFGTNVTAEGVAACLAAFQRQIVVEDTPWSRYYNGETEALTEGQKKGYAVFQKYNCENCHYGTDLRDNGFHNLGVDFFLRNQDLGRQGVTKLAADKGKFSTPTLIGLRLTAPYMHTGSFITLKDVIEYLDRGGVRNERKDNRGRLVRDANIDPQIVPLGMTPAEKADLLIFLTEATEPLDYPYFTQPTLPQ